jgi:hypothetical protein
MCELLQVDADTVHAHKWNIACRPLQLEHARIVWLQSLTYLCQLKTKQSDLVPVARHGVSRHTGLSLSLHSSYTDKQTANVANLECKQPASCHDTLHLQQLRADLKKPLAQQQSCHKQLVRNARCCYCVHSEATFLHRPWHSTSFMLSAS